MTVDSLARPARFERAAFRLGGVRYIHLTKETYIKIRFNTLCRQFKNNAKYYSLGDFELSDDEDISYEIPINNKRYDAVYYQKNTANPEETIEEASMRSVWFMIHSEYGKYRIVMFYDNEYNHAQGEDL